MNGEINNEKTFLKSTGILSSLKYSVDNAFGQSLRKKKTSLFDDAGGQHPKNGVPVKRDGNKTIVSGTDGNDKIHIKQSPDGSITITVNEDEVTISRQEAQNLLIEGGKGNDKITADGSVTVGLTIGGGEGDDKIIGGSGNDVISGAAGRDYIEGGQGDDAIGGGEGGDIIYGIDGNDRIEGGLGNDYIDGGQGDDILSGGDGDDIIFGGRGNDKLEGGGADDILAGGQGKDIYDGGKGKDKIFYQEDDIILNKEAGDIITETTMESQKNNNAKPGSSIIIEGDDEFKKRVESDIDALRSIPTGRKMLEALDKAGYPISIRESKRGSCRVGGSGEDELKPDGAKGKGESSVIFYNPSDTHIYGDINEAWDKIPPVIGLYHELVHAYNASTGTTQLGDDAGSGMPNSELQAIGLPNSGIPYDHDGNPSTPPQTGNPSEFTENGLRDELGMPRRPVRKRGS